MLEILRRGLWEKGPSLSCIDQYIRSVGPGDLVLALLGLPSRIDIGASNVQVSVTNLTHEAAEAVREVVHRDLEHLLGVI